MKFSIHTFRLWWQVPRSVCNRPQDRKVTFLELFYDIVYVIVISALTHTFAKDISVNTFIQFIFLFVFIWWAWLSGTFYHELYGNNDIRTRVFTFLQMLVVASMAVFVHDAFGESANNFALSCIVFQIIILFLWWRTGVHVTGGIVTTGVIILYIIKHFQETLPNFVRILLSVSVMVTLLGIFFLMATFQLLGKCAQFRAVSQYVIVSISIVITVLGFLISHYYFYC